MSNNKTGWIVALVAALLLLVAIVGFEVVSYRPSYCGRCHRPDYSFWTRSSHSDVACYDCHGSRGSLSAVTNKLEEYFMVGAQLTGLYEKPVTAFVGNANCIGCHKSIIENPVVARFGIRMRHSDVIKAGMRCTECHNTVAHGRATKNPTSPFMDTCTSCHNGKQASAKCETCHYKKEEDRPPTPRVAPWAVTHGEKWTRTHGMGNLRTCAVCHTDEFCTQCHGMQLPHGTGWPAIHGHEAVKNLESVDRTDKARSCVGCHLRSFCNGCHRMPMPHPPEFLPRHWKEYKRLGKRVCENCHVLADCDDCHTKHIHPGRVRDPHLSPQQR